jgi:sulfur carrier protein ThiS
MVKVDGRELLWREGMTVADLLKELDDPYPYAVARIGNKLIARHAFEGATVPENSEVFFIPLIVGG